MKSIEIIKYKMKNEDINSCFYALIKRFRILKDSEFFGIFYYFSSFGTILFIIIIIPSFPNRPLLAKISKTATLSVTKLYTHVDPYLLSCT